MIIISQDKEKIINFNNVADIEIIKITEFETTQTTYFKKEDIGKYSIRLLYLMPMIVGDISTGITDDIGIYEKEKRAKEILIDIVKNYELENRKFNMPED